MVLRRGLCALAFALLAGASVAAPLPSADLNPLLAGFAYDAPARLAPASHAASLTLNWSSTAVIKRSGDEVLIVDAEVREWRAHFARSLNERWMIQMHVPLRRIDGGTLDSAIEAWHDLFGFPEGPRAVLQNDRLRMEYRRGATTVFNYRDTRFSGLGDIALESGWQLTAKERYASAVWLQMTLPTGDADRWTGTGRVGASLLLSHTRALGSRANLFGHGGIAYRSTDGVLRAQQRSSLWLAMIGMDLRVTDRLNAGLQLDSHGAAYESHGLDLLGDAHILGVGADYAFTNRWRAQFSVSEDLSVDASPDVTFTVKVSREW